MKKNGIDFSRRKDAHNARSALIFGALACEFFCKNSGENDDNLWREECLNAAQTLRKMANSWGNSGKSRWKR